MRVNISLRSILDKHRHRSFNPWVFLIAICLHLIATVTHATVMTGRVDRVVDGDTVMIGTNRVRLAGIDAPELSQPYGRESKAALTALVTGKTVTLHITGRDRYRRIIANIYLDDTWINQRLISTGHAWHYRKYSRDTDLAAAEKSARAARSGLWKTRSPSPPWSWRERGRGAVASVR